MGTTATRPSADKVRSMKKHLLDIDSTCNNCGTWVTMDTCHLDHIVPHSRGGSQSIENMQILCAPCNLSKGNRMTKSDVERGAFHGMPKRVRPPHRIEPTRLRQWPEGATDGDLERPALRRSALAGFAVFVLSAWIADWGTAYLLAGLTFVALSVFLIDSARSKRLRKYGRLVSDWELWIAWKEAGRTYAVPSAPVPAKGFDRDLFASHLARDEQIQRLTAANEYLVSQGERPIDFMPEAAQNYWERIAKMEAELGIVSTRPQWLMDRNGAA